MPCTNWVQMLTARHQDDLTEIDRLALNAHLSSCRGCHEVYTAYKSLIYSFNNRGTTLPVPAFFHQPSQCEKKALLARRASSGHVFLSMIFALLSSLYVYISWSRLYQKIYTLILMLAYLPRRITYANSKGHFLYAIRSDSGYLLWKQKRYRRWDFVSTPPLRGNSMPLQSSGSGIALVAAEVFCKYAVQP